MLVVKSLPANAGDIRDQGWTPGSGRSPEKKMATHSRILAWKIPLTEELGRLQSMASQRGGHDRVTHTQSVQGYARIQTVQGLGSNLKWQISYLTQMEVKT